MMAALDQATFTACAITTVACIGPVLLALLLQRRRARAERRFRALFLGPAERRVARRAGRA